jgi:hypothetical protein
MKIKIYVNRKENGHSMEIKSVHRCTLPVLLILYPVVLVRPGEKKNCPCERHSLSEKPKFSL